MAGFLVGVGRRAEDVAVRAAPVAALLWTPRGAKAAAAATEATAPTSACRSCGGEAADDAAQSLSAALEVVAALAPEASGEEASAALARLDAAAGRALWQQRAILGPPTVAGASVDDALVASGGSDDGASDTDPAEDGGDPAAAALARRALARLGALARSKLALAARAGRCARAAALASAACRAAARVDVGVSTLLRAELSAGELSWGVASALRWACWDAAWYWSCTRRGDAARARRHLAAWRARRRLLLNIPEFPQGAASALLRAAWAACRHVVDRGWPASAVAAWSGEEADVVAARGPHAATFVAELEALRHGGQFGACLLQELRGLFWSVAWHVANRNRGRSAAASAALVRTEQHLRRACRSPGSPPWRGVNLGGWFLLEPGPCSDFWLSLPPDARATQCEWDCCEALGPELAASLLGEHRRSYFGPAEFEEIRSSGVTHVRLPFGAWCVIGPRPGEPYVGPCLEDLDRAVDVIEAAGLQVVLDLHGVVGGENGCPPCGRRFQEWHYTMWDVDATLAALRLVAERYAGRLSVCAVGVCNEPCMSVPFSVLASYYEAAVETVRRAGMRAGEVTVLLPAFTEWRAPELLAYWEASYPKYEDCAFDLHLYQCFGAYWATFSFPGHLRAASARAELLRSLPASCITEWSVCLPGGITRGKSEEERIDMYRRFGALQLEAYAAASHGWFFWTWKDSAGVDWNLRDCLRCGLLKL